MKQEEVEERFQGPVSPPARGAWIETVSMMPAVSSHSVAPRAGGVD